MISATKLMKSFNEMVTYESRNGLLGMNRDVVLRTCWYVKLEQTRQLLGIDKNTFAWSKHHYLRLILLTIFRRSFGCFGYVTNWKSDVATTLKKRYAEEAYDLAGNVLCSPDKFFFDLKNYPGRVLQLDVTLDVGMEPSFYKFCFFDEYIYHPILASENNNRLHTVQKYFSIFFVYHSKLDIITSTLSNGQSPLQASTGTRFRFKLYPGTDPAIVSNELIPPVGKYLIKFQFVKSGMIPSRVRYDLNLLKFDSLL